jgi:hypothetical protein
LTWQGVDGADVYQVAVHDGASWFIVVQTGGTSYAIPAGRLVAGHTYVWVVFAHNSVGWSPPSTGWTFTTAGSVPSAPVLLSPSDGASGVGLTPILSWNAVEGADVYQVAVTDGSSWIVVAQTAGTSFTVPAGKLLTGHAYVWVVFAHNSIGWSNQSAAWSFTS